MTNRIPEIIDTIRRSFGDLSTPHFGFVGRTCREIRRHEVLDDLLARFWVRDDTDLNYDHALHLRLWVPPTTLSVCLSAVRPWAMVFRERDNLYERVMSEPEDFKEEERELLDVLTRHGFRLLSKAEAAQPLDMRLPGTDPEHVRIYHAVIADDTVVPEVLKL